MVFSQKAEQMALDGYNFLSDYRLKEKGNIGAVKHAALE